MIIQFHLVNGQIIHFKESRKDKDIISYVKNISLESMISIGDDLHINPRNIGYIELITDEDYKKMEKYDNEKKNKKDNKENT